MSKRIDKLVQVKQRAVDGAEAALAAARAATAAAELALVETEKAWSAALSLGANATSSGELDEADARARTLRQAVQRAEWAVVVKRREEEPRRAAVAAARQELRRFEMWSERAVATTRATAARVARLAEDDLAARKQRSE